MKNPWNILLYILLSGLALWLCGAFILPIGFPFILGYLIARLSRRFRPRKWNSTIFGIFSVSITFLILSILLWVVFRTIFSEGQQLARKLPGMLKDLSPTLDFLYKKLLALAQRLPDGLAQPAVQWVEKLFAGGSLFLDSLSEWLIGGAARLLSRIPDLILFLLTTLLSAYFFAVDDRHTGAFLQKHIPESWLEKGTILYSRLKAALKGYGKSQLYLSAITFGLCAFGLLILGYRKGIFIAFAIGLIDALPVFGAGTVLIPWSLLSYLQGDMSKAIGILLLYAVVSITRTILEPRFLGKQMGLHPLLTLISLYGGFRLFGLWGLIFLPIGVMLIKQLYDLSVEF